MIRTDWIFSINIKYDLIATCCVLLLSTRVLAAGPQESEVRHSEKSISLYEIQSGETLLGIALEHGFTLDALKEANGIEDADKVYAGQMLRFPIDPKHGRLTKRGVLLSVPKGFNLTRIAAAYQISTAEIIKANQLTNPNHLREGQELLVPGAKHVVELVPPPPCYKDPVSLYRVRNGDSLEIPLCFCDGNASPDGVQGISDISKPIGEESSPHLNPRLVSLVQKVAENYPGKRIEIISGYRSNRQKGNESNHNKGRALDFRISGITNKELVGFLRTLENVGVGYYPNSVFVHLDIRETSGYWVDYSRPGERAIYGRKGMSKLEIEKIRKQRMEKVLEQLDVPGGETAHRARKNETVAKPMVDSSTKDRSRS